VKLPVGYDEVEVAGVQGFAIRNAEPWMRDVLSSGATLSSWAAAESSGTPMEGRGKVFSVPAPTPGPDSRERWVVRHYYRGGAVAAPLLGDRYLSVGRPRPVRELFSAHNARARGIPTPAVVAGAIYPSGFWYRADLVTEQIPDAADLAEVLFGANPSNIDLAEALLATGALVRNLEQRGILHPDLNAKNVVLAPVGGKLVAHLVDLDRCCARAPGVPAPAYFMRRRLERSLRKFEHRTGQLLPSDAWAVLRAGFADRDEKRT
jgi:hypothetical protein